MNTEYSAGLRRGLPVTEYSAGLRRGLPVGMGYFSVSFGFGAMAVSQGVRAWEAALISLTNLTCLWGWGISR